MITPDASFTALQQHFRKMNARGASMPYTEAIHMCLGCGRMDENTIGKKYDRFRLCSTECEALLQAYEASYGRLKEAPSLT